MDICTMLGRLSLHAIFALCLGMVPLAATASASAQPVTQPGAGQSAPTAGSPTPSVSSYRINPGDQLEVYVWGEERLQRELTVLPDGTIAFPLVGQLQVAGRLPQEIEHMVSAGLRDQYRGEVPFVTVSVKAPTGMRYSVLGKVKSPGTFTTVQYVNVLEALSQAGGADDFADLDSVLLIRGTGPASRSFQIRLARLFKADPGQQAIQSAGIVRVEPGDVIIVP